jgi:penicillin-binding protein 2
VKDGMWAVLNEPGGTAFSQHINAVPAGGKTGTVQVVGRETSENLPKAKRIEDHAWFAGFAPVGDPQIVVVVFVENGGHGSTAAAPLARAIFEKRFGKTPEEPSANGLVRASLPGGDPR